VVLSFSVLPSSLHPFECRRERAETGVGAGAAGVTAAGTGPPAEVGGAGGAGDADATPAAGTPAKPRRGKEELKRVRCRGAGLRSAALPVL
jgi:hypothetical protein